MKLRYQETLETLIASQDLIELDRISYYGDAGRYQFAAECSQNSYTHMLKTQDSLVGFYTSEKTKNALKVSGAMREEMVE